MNQYDHKKIEKKWQKVWEKGKYYEAKVEKKGRKFYGLVEFPYPSGDGLHVGHVRSYTAMDVISRKHRLQGENVMYPIGWDAFGLPTENYAIKTGINPAIVTKQNTDTFRQQLKSLGLSFDWSREINTTDPKYYKWTQWIFLQLFKKGLAYKSKVPINWCLNCKIGLANEEVVDGKCERCGGPTEKRDKEQWMLAITKYAERLDKDLDGVDYIPQVVTQQRNWIGRSEGAVIEFKLKAKSQELETISVFTTRPDTLFGATYIVVAPEHPLIKAHEDRISNYLEVKMYLEFASRKDEKERTDISREKTGVKLEGLVAINPANNEEIPIFVADYVLMGYGTGSIMAVPAHDERDFEFAKKFNLAIRQVIDKEKDLTTLPYTEEGRLINSGKFDGMDSEKAKWAITKAAGGKKTTSFKLRDWVFSRQRYWGEPIPIIHCQKCGFVPVPEKELPVVLPKIQNYKPTDNGESPLAKIDSWVNTKCPKCKGKAKRETDVMPNWAGSSWYFLRYCDPKNSKEFASKKNLKYFLPVDWYNGGMEHTTLHLLYSRFWHKFLYDLKLVPTREPYAKRTSHGLILAEGGVKMSKSKGNVINPDTLVEKVGADTLRLYEMFMGPFDQAIAWNTDSMVGRRRFIERIWRLQERIEKKRLKIKNEKLEILIHRTIKKVGEDIENLRMNTAVSSLMILSNEFEKIPTISKAQFEIFLILLSPFTPHLTEEIWHNLGNKKSIQLEKWPKFDSKKFLSETAILPVSINGKTRGMISVEAKTTKEEVIDLIKREPNLMKWLRNGFDKVIYIEGKIINFVINK